MQWSLVKSWAKDNGYTSFREKSDRVDDKSKYDYYWGKVDDPSVSGLATSVSKLAAQIYNHISNNEHIEYQEEYKTKASEQDINHNDFKEGW